jgi:hypothetical protein
MGQVMIRCGMAVKIIDMDLGKHGVYLNEKQL